MTQKTISVLGMGWLGLPLGGRLVLEGHIVKGSTTSEPKLETIRKGGSEPYLLQAGPDLVVRNHKSFFDCDILVLTIPPSAISPGGRKSRSEPDGRYAQTIEAILDHKPGKGPERVIYTSSISVYGEDVGAVDEDSTLAPLTTSAKMVRQAEEIVRERFPDKHHILRLGGLVGGKRQPARYLAGRTGLSRGSAAVNLVHLQDCIGAIASLVWKPVESATFNLVAPGHPTRRDYYSRIAQTLGLALPDFDLEDERPGKHVDGNRITDVIDFSYQHPHPFHFPVG